MKRPGLVVLAAVGARLIAGCGGGTTDVTSSGTASTAPSLATPADGELFEDPDGASVISVDPDWSEGSVLTPKVWYPGEAESGFGDNVNVLVEQLPAGVDLEDDARLSLANAPKLIEDFTLIASDRVTPRARGVRVSTSAGTEPAGNSSSCRSPRWPRGARAVVVTLTALPDRIERRIAAAEPYMRTVVATG